MCLGNRVPLEGSRAYFGQGAMALVRGRTLDPSQHGGEWICGCGATCCSEEKVFVAENSRQQKTTPGVAFVFRSFSRATIFFCFFLPGNTDSAFFNF